MKKFILLLALFTICGCYENTATYEGSIGVLGGNPYFLNSTANPYGAGNRYNPNSIFNTYGKIWQSL
jgi:hypothetical protein